MEIQNLEALLVEELKDILGAERQILDAVPKMIEAATADELKSALRDHLEKTRRHVERVERAFEMLGAEAEEKVCKGMAGLLQEGGEVLRKSMPDAIRDAAIIGAAQRVEHYEMAAYGVVRSFAQQLGRLDVAQMLQANLDEEGDADRLLTQIAEFHVNIAANGGEAGSAARDSAKDADIVAVQNQLEEVLGLPVRIAADTDPRSGAVTIRYRTLDQLDLICQRLSGGGI